MKKIRVLDLFSGIGGFALGLEMAGGFETVAFCEKDEYCQGVLNKNFPNIPIHKDITLLSGEIFHEIDVVCGGFPCQPYSIAGGKKAKKDDRDLWPEMFRVIKEAKPTWVIGENVPNFVNLAFTRTKTDLESIGYTLQPFIIPACAVDAEQPRDRLWIIAHLNSTGLDGKTNAQKEKDFKGVGEGHWWTARPSSFGNWWADKSRMGRAIYGVSGGVDKYREQRVAALGNSVIPDEVAIIGEALRVVHNFIKKEGLC